MSVAAQFYQLGEESSPINRMAIIKAVQDLIDTATGEAMEFDIVIPANCTISDVLVDVPVAPQNAADATFDSVTVSVGDSASATGYVNAAQVAKLNGSPVQLAKAAASTNKTYTAADTLKITVTPKTGHALSSLTSGIINVYLRLQQDGALG